ncbi:hypothetical protein HDU87_006805 [Geranomyces variabilis]|uniref:Uncharacterized protein n=1 Tax=Geranomyces variabilis TaxID=109894 RepID=A0AAD5XTW1_9FUNG|nr:hypothetical protein HDU87_006805 [Geranomyces variabilis]
MKNADVFHACKRKEKAKQEEISQKVYNLQQGAAKTVGELGATMNGWKPAFNAHEATINHFLELARAPAKERKRKALEAQPGETPVAKRTRRALQSRTTLKGIEGIALSAQAASESSFDAQAMQPDREDACEPSSSVGTPIAEGPVVDYESDGPDEIMDVNVFVNAKGHCFTEEAGKLWDRYLERVTAMRKDRCEDTAQAGRHLDCLGRWFVMDAALATTFFDHGEETFATKVKGIMETRMRLSRAVVRLLGTWPGLSEFAMGLTAMSSEPHILVDSWTWGPLSYLLRMTPVPTAPILPDALVASLATGG